MSVIFYFFLTTKLISLQKIHINNIKLTLSLESENLPNLNNVSPYNDILVFTFSWSFIVIVCVFVCMWNRNRKLTCRQAIEFKYKSEFPFFSSSGPKISNKSWMSTPATNRQTFLAKRKDILEFYTHLLRRMKIAVSVIETAATNSHLSSWSKVAFLFYFVHISKASLWSGL